MEKIVNIREYKEKLKPVKEVKPDGWLITTANDVCNFRSSFDPRTCSYGKGIAPCTQENCLLRHSLFLQK